VSTQTTVTDTTAEIKTLRKHSGERVKLNTSGRQRQGHSELGNWKYVGPCVFAVDNDLVVEKK